MNRLEKANKILATAEASVRTLVGEAANAGDYDEILSLTNIAKALANIPNSTVVLRQADPRIDQPRPNGKSIPTRSGSHLNGKEKRKSTSKPKSKSYPRFLQSNGDLVKVGWSKSDAKEYQHKAPRQVLGAVTEAIKVQRTNDGELRPPQEFLPLTTPSGETIPDYQSYLCIAWLRDIGIVQRHGRHGYRVPDPTSIENRIEQAWKELSHA